MAEKITFGFADYLDEQAMRRTDLRKGARTRARLKAAAARVLDVKGYREMQIGEVAEEAGISVGAIYKHFQNKRALVLEVTQDFLEYNGKLMLSIPQQDDAYAQLVATNLCHVWLFSSNIGLMRCVRQLSDELPEFNKLWLESNERWYGMVARSIGRRGEVSAMDSMKIKAMAHALGGMVDEFLHDLYLRGNEALKSLRDSPEECAEILSLVWYRSVYLDHPKSEKVRSSRRTIRKGLETMFHDEQQLN